MFLFEWVSHSAVLWEYKNLWLRGIQFNFSSNSISLLSKCDIYIVKKKKKEDLHLFVSQLPKILKYKISNKNKKCVGENKVFTNCTKGQCILSKTVYILGDIFFTLTYS